MKLRSRVRLHGAPTVDYRPAAHRLEVEALTEDHPIRIVEYVDEPEVLPDGEVEIILITRREYLEHLIKEQARDGPRVAPHIIVNSQSNNPELVNVMPIVLFRIISCTFVQERDENNREDVATIYTPLPGPGTDFRRTGHIDTIAVVAVGHGVVDKWQSGKRTDGNF